MAKEKMVYDDPRVFGPNTWRKIHQAARNMTLSDFLDYFVTEIHRIPCLVCRRHATKYIRTHSFEKYQDELGPFRYTWMFHNTVNKRLGKQLLSFEDSLLLYPKNKETITPRPPLYPFKPATIRPTVLAY